jgi:predicted RNase H-like nuclease (RuvC/YqgF family)
MSDENRGRQGGRNRRWKKREPAASDAVQGELQDAAVSESEDSPASEEAPVQILHGAALLERLRDRVEVAARELTRLREENEALRTRLEQMSGNADLELADSISALDEDPEVVRRKVRGFIELIDRYLEPDADETPA